MNANHQLLDTLHQLGRTGQPVARLYARMLDEDLFLAAYAKLYSNRGALPPGVDPTDQIDGMSRQRIRTLIQLLKTNRWRWSDARRTYIPKRTGQRRALGIPSWSNKLVQEVMRMVLEAYYEPRFTDASHGFRPHRSCHTALLQIRTTWTGMVWFIEGDIKRCFDQIDHQRLLDLIGTHIRDFRFLKLLRTLLRAGYWDRGNQHPTFSGTAQGSGVSPILANIFLHELDHYVLNVLKPGFDHGQRRRPHPEYQRYCTRISTAKRNGDGATVAALRKQRKQLPAGDPYDPNYRRLVYVRYADDFLIGIIGSKADCRAIKAQVREKLAQLGLELSDDKTKITNAASGCARFLGYDIFKFQDRRHPQWCGSIQLNVPKPKMRELAKRYMHHGKPHQRNGLIHAEVAEIVLIYDIELRGYYNYYQLAGNVGKQLAHLRYVMWQSLTRTLARKLRSRTRAINRRYKGPGPKTGNACLRVKLAGKNGDRWITFGDLRLTTTHTARTPVDHPHFRPYLPIRELTLRLKHTVCELCERPSNVLEAHHIRRLSDIRRQIKNGTAKPWQLVMAARRRKTLVVCKACHTTIHQR